jgi:hypothetical protein
VDSAQPFLMGDTFTGLCNVTFDADVELKTFPGIYICLAPEDVPSFASVAEKLDDLFVLISFSTTNQLVPFDNSENEDDWRSSYELILNHRSLVGWCACGRIDRCLDGQARRQTDVLAGRQIDAAPARLFHGLLGAYGYPGRAGRWTDRCCTCPTVP